MTTPANLIAPFLAMRQARLELVHTASGAGGTAGSVSCAFGAEAADRYIVAHLVLHNGESTNIGATITIGGVTATIVALREDIFIPCAIAIAAVPAGTSGTVAWSATGGPDNWSLAVYRLTGAESPVPVFADSGSASNPISINTTALPAGAAVIAAASCAGNPDDISFSSPLVEDYALEPQGRAEAAHLIANGGALSLSCSFDGGTQTNTSNRTLLVAAWR